jgi:Flp pilus assembly pilin Flp
MANKKFPNLKKERGASMVEYALIAALVSLMGVASMQTIGAHISREIICKAGESLAGSANGDPNECGNTAAEESGW